MIYEICKMVYNNIGVLYWSFVFTNAVIEHSILTPGRRGNRFWGDDRHVNLGFEWGASPYGWFTEKQLSRGTPLLSPKN